MKKYKIYIFIRKNKENEGEDMKLLENAYGNFLQASFFILNPFKKALIKTQCKVHKFINVQALEIIKNDQYEREYNFFRNYIMAINDGTVWADQDFKSSQHFYNPHSSKGLYGRNNAMDLAQSYYEKSKKLWEIGEFDQSLFYFGGTIHLVQDMTIPQHANIRLLDNHRQYENFIKRTYRYVNDFKVIQGSVLLDSIEEYIKFNARTAMKIYDHFKCIGEDDQRYYRITKCSLPLAERTTAGCMILFYKEIFKS